MKRKKNRVLFKWENIKLHEKIRAHEDTRGNFNHRF